MPTIDELLAIENENKRKAEDRKKYLAEKDYFVIVSNAPWSEYPNSIIRLTDFKSQLERYSGELYQEYAGHVKIVYRTNKWMENHPEEL